MAKTSKPKDTFDEGNEVSNDFMKFNEVGDFVKGILLSKRQVPSTLPDKKGEMQWIYEARVIDAKFHDGDGEEVSYDEGSNISIGGRKVYDSRMRNIKIGQEFGLKYVEELPAKTKGYNPTKLIKVYAPKGTDGEFIIHDDVAAEQVGEIE